METVTNEAEDQARSSTELRAEQLLAEARAKRLSALKAAEGLWSLISGPKIRLPDAIIAGSAVAHHLPIVTRNPKDFKWTGIDVHVPYDYDSITGEVTNVRPPFSDFKPKPTITRIN